MAERNDDNKTTAAAPAARPATTRDGDAGEREVKQRVDAENEQGFVGIEVDPTPNSAYTVAGVTAGEPTPETDPAAAKAVGSRRFDTALTGADPARA